MPSMEHQSSRVNPLRPALGFSVLETISYTILSYWPIWHILVESARLYVVTLLCTAGKSSWGEDIWGIGPGTWGKLSESSICLAGARPEPERDGDHPYAEQRLRGERDRMAAGRVAKAAHRKRPKR